MKWRFLAGWVALGMVLSARVAGAQSLLDCSCLAKQSVLFTNVCCGVIPDLCLVASNCYSSTVVPPPGFTCSQNPPPGTPVCSSTPITFILTENLTGNSAFCTVTFNTGVSTNVFTALCPPTQVVPCNSTNWSFGPPGWTNTCCTVGMVTNLVSIVTNWPVISATWTIIDGCGVAATCNQSIAFFNTNGPCVCVGITCPPDILLQTCLPPFTSAGGFTNVTYPLPVATNYCIGTITNIVCTPPSGSPFPVGMNVVTCTAYDNLGNSATCTFNIVVLGDTTPPIITCPPPQTNICGTIWSPTKPTAVDACCGTNVIVTLIATTTNTFAPCDDLITYKWVATDCNGNQSAPCTSIVHVIDPIPPVITCRGNYTIQCGTLLTPPLATDNCCPNPTVTMQNVITNGTVPCNYKLTITWQAQDCCTNIATCTEIVSIIDTTPPALACAPNKTVECSQPWTFDAPVVSDACCGSNVTLTITSTITNIAGAPCLTVATRQWQATDCCNNSATCSQTVTIVDTTPPTLTCFPNKSVQCGSPWTFDPPTALDGCCGASVTITVLSTVTNNLTRCPGTITRTWRATDCCNNSATCSQTVTNVDNTPPVLTCAPNMTIAVGTPWTFTPPTAVDACCGTNLAINVLATTTNYNRTNCQMVHRRIWRAVDCCNNFSLCVQTVAVQYGPPPNDVCTNAIPLIVNSGYLCGNNLCATPSAPGSLVPAPCGNSVNAPDVWYSLLAPCTGPMIVDTCAPCPGEPPFDTVLSAYNATCPGPLTQIPGACNDNAPGCGLRSSITFNAIAGQTYLLRVAGAGNAVGWFSLQAQLTSPALTNDFCAGAIAILPGSPAACGTTVCATPSQPGDLIPAPCGNSLNTPDVWYSYTPTCPEFVTINTCGNCAGSTNYNTVLSVYTGTCPRPLTQVVCNDDAVGVLCAAPQSQVTFFASAGVTYYVRVSGAGPGTVGSFRLNLSTVAGPPPPNDFCANAIAVTPGTYPWNNCYATTDGPITNNCPPGNLTFGYSIAFQDVWFKYTAPCAGPAFVTACDGGLGITFMNVYSGTCGSLNLLGCAFWGGYCPSYNAVNFNAVAGTTYYFRLGETLPGAPPVSAGMFSLVGPTPTLPTCPPPGPCSWRYFRLTGPPSCIPWGWSIIAPCCMRLQNLNVPAVCFGDEDTLAAAFVNSINAAAAAAGCSGISAVAFPVSPGRSLPGRFGICTTCVGTNQFTLGVGAAGLPPQVQCIVPIPGGYVAIPVGSCGFNPDIAEIPLTGHDLNNNGFDDGFDIDSGTSQDLNGNGIPDEVEGCLPPTLAAEPQSQTVDPGTPVTLTVALGGGTGPFSYSWTRNSSPLSDAPNLSGTSTASLAIGALTATEAGDYSVTVSNFCGSVVTVPANVSLTAPVLPILYDLSLVDGWFRFTVETRIGFDYRVEYKNNLDDATWTLLTTIPGSGQPELILDSEPLPQTRFYRVLQQLPP